MRSRDSVEREIALAGLDDALNPSFSPDGKSARRSAATAAASSISIASRGASGRRDMAIGLTHDPFADLEPTFTPDGTVDRLRHRALQHESRDARARARFGSRVSISPRTPCGRFPGFLRGKHSSPQVSPTGASITFIAEPDGVSNLYRMPIDGGADRAAVVVV